jgi:hypothetical protein
MDITERVKRNNFAPAKYERQTRRTAQNSDLSGIAVRALQPGTIVMSLQLSRKSPDSEKMAPVIRCADMPC